MYYYNALSHYYKNLLVNYFLFSVVKKPSISILPQNKSIIESSLVVLRCIVNTSDPVNITWFFNNKPLQTNSEELLLTNVQRKQAGAYSCIIKNSFGSSSSLSLNVMINCKSLYYFTVRSI